MLVNECSEFELISYEEMLVGIMTTPTKCIDYASVRYRVEEGVLAPDRDVAVRGRIIAVQNAVRGVGRISVVAHAAVAVVAPRDVGRVDAVLVHLGRGRLAVVVPARIDDRLGRCGCGVAVGHGWGVAARGGVAVAVGHGRGLAARGGVEVAVVAGAVAEWLVWAGLMGLIA